MQEASALIGDAELARWLTTDVPGAILAGQRLPQRPEVQPRRRGRLARLLGSR